MRVFKYVKRNSLFQNKFKKDEKILLFDKVNVAKSFFKKLTGLIFSKSLDINDGLLIEECNSIHTLWMRFAIDVVFLNRENIVIEVVENLKPFRVSPIVKEAVKVLELKSGAVRQKKIKKNDILAF